MTNSCIFCKIASGEIQADLIYQDELFVAFHDLAPQAPVHVLIIPRTHYSSLLDVEDNSILSGLLATAQKISRQMDVAESGWRSIINTGQDGGQTVMHLHLHLLGGRFMQWPPG